MNIERAEVKNENIIPSYQNSAENKDNMMMSSFLDFLTKSVIYKPESLVPYTPQMSKEANNLLLGVDFESD